jgi:Fic family protein
MIALVITGFPKISSFFMSQGQNPYLSRPVSVFLESRLPDAAVPVGYAALIEAHSLEVPLPRQLSAVSPKNKAITSGQWRIFPARYAPDASLEGHLVFALKHEGVQLLTLKKLFEALGPHPIETLVRKEPTGAYARRIWFLFEWLMGCRLDLPDASRGSYTTALTERQYGVPGTRSQRHRVLNNLPGTPEFCPLIFATDKLQSWIGQNLAAEAMASVARVPKDLLARTAAFLLLKDSRSSFEIEGERPPQNRIQRWGRVIGEAGRLPFDLDELFRLQRIVIGDDRLITLGLRTEDGFVGEHDRATGAPLPDHIDARPEDLPSLLQGLIDFDHGPSSGLDAVMAATSLAFGFVYIHPLQDGNGRLHRYLIHHVLSQRGFHPPGVVFPVSSAILERIMDYKAVLESYSRRLLPLIAWEATPRGNVHVLNETADYYRYPDLTRHAEFLYETVAKTIREDLPKEAGFLERYDRFRSALQDVIDMPEATANLLFRFLDQNDGIFSRRAREKEFARLSADEVAKIEELYADIFR